MIDQELPVFFDQSKRRWKVIRLSLAILTLAIIIFAAWLWPAILAPVPVRSGADAPPMASRSVDELVAAVNLRNVPVVGEGALVRLLEVKIHPTEIDGADPFTHETLVKFTSEDLLEIGDHPYVFERYGTAPAKRLMLTFDDGPDEVYTPQLLDLLSKESVPATFFMIGTNVIKYPEIAKRVVREGHEIGNHTLTHDNINLLDSFSATQQINLNAHILRATTGHAAAYFRPPYAATIDQGLRDGVRSILIAQRLGYALAFYDYDTRDWAFISDHKTVLSQLDPQKDHVLLLHDGGGNRSYTIDYTRQLIHQAKAAGFTFSTLDQLQGNPPSFVPAEPSFTDVAVLTIGNVLLVWPHELILRLFALSVGLLLISMVVNVALAMINRRRARRLQWPRKFKPYASVIIPAFNEERVLEHSVRSLLQSKYRRLEVIIIDDGSKDGTFAVAQKMARFSRRVTAVSRHNHGKAAALNHGISLAKGEVVICVDADTVFPPQTIGKLVRHFSNPRVGGVAGMVKVGNTHNLLARWQSLEYITGIHIERSAQACLNAVMIVPGACGAWRRDVVLKVGGYSRATLAEDCDLTLSVCQAGYLIAQDNEAISYTECPLNIADLAKQRFRWLFGDLQSFWKHRRMFLNKNYRWLGMLVLPNAALSILLPLFFWPLLLLLTAENLAAGRITGLFLFLGATVCIHFIMAIIGLRLAKESMSHLIVVPMTRFVYGPLRTYLLYRSMITALRGVSVGWNKFTRSGMVAKPKRASRVSYGKILVIAFYALALSFRHENTQSLGLVR